MSLSLNSLRKIAACAGWQATYRLTCASKGSLEIRVIRLELAIEKRKHPRGPLSWVALKMISDFLGEVSSSQLTQTSPGPFEMRLLRKIISATAEARQIHYSHLADDSDVYPYGMESPSSDDGTRALWKRWVGDD